ncbi:hypothetical protein TraAM80_07845 [Trypanosoma rangeli]|uniref:Uncharacterized protein n=1 Tax=Trypanosoma rangeli TaxID=5698 RepID=A0A3R7LMQ0_TRYRA|nr:uncharacterized protein TraAM80_07845 [Trypanosoma rangeli]RNF00018.1 hypothetical protein TraAM80_07845 [Trypanosoma rangeli]|eukprot:RNF00018.1 hypothetical protein TraAM80_07845 [Trypanosoma rangeli]
MFLDARETPLPCPTATLPETLQVLAEHPHGDAVLVHAALARLMLLDSTDADSETIASFQPPDAVSNPFPAATGSFNAATDAGVEYPFSSSSSSAPHLTLQLMSAHPNDGVVRERCCRCIANMCQLSSSSSSAGRAVEPSSVGSDNNSAGDERSFADELVEQGAVELVLGTLAMSSRLSAKGLAWAAQALLNLVCLSRDGARRTARTKGETVLADVIAGTTHESIVAGSLSVEQCAALDAMLGVLARLLTSEADDNAAGVHYRCEQAAYGTVEAVGAALVWLSASAKREICGSDAKWGMRDGSIGGRCGGTLFFPTAAPPHQAAVLAFLPPLHKAWMTLRSIIGCSRNLPMVYEALHMPGDGGGLRDAIDAVLLFGVELEGLSAMGATEEATLQQDMLLYALETFADLSATRKDLGDRAVAEAAALSEATTEPNSQSGEEGGEVEGISAVFPTEAALGVSEILAEGVVSNIAVSTLVRLHTAEYRQGSGRKSTAHVYDGAVFDVLAKSLLTLANLAGQDIAVASMNTVAPLHAILQESTNCLSAIRAVHRASSSQFLSSASQQELMAVVQQCALTGQVYAVLWGILSTPDGVRAAGELKLRDAVSGLQTILETLYADAFPDDGRAVAGISSTEAPREATAAQQTSLAGAAARTTPTIAAAIEILQKLIPFGEKVLQCLRLTSAEASPTQTEHARQTSVSGSAAGTVSAIHVTVEHLNT